MRLQALKCSASEALNAESYKGENMGLFTPNTGDEKMDKAYVNLRGHVNKCKSFDEFLQHFNYIVKTDDPETLKKWLLKVLFVNMKYASQTQKHDFDKLLESVDDAKREELKNWLVSSLEKQGGHK